MALTLAHWLVWLVTAYLALGVVIGVAFAWRGVQNIDPCARDGTPGFRLLIVPGCIALWPVVLRRWRGTRETPPVECNAHRRAAATGDAHD